MKGDNFSLFFLIIHIKSVSMLVVTIIFISTETSYSNEQKNDCFFYKYDLDGCMHIHVFHVYKFCMEIHRK